MSRATAVLVAAVAVLVSAGVALLAQPRSRTFVQLSVELPDNPMAGARLFASKSCGRCHALGGQTGQVGPDLGRIHFPGSILDLAGSFWNHAPVMREKMEDLKIQRPTLSSPEMADLIAFLTAYRYYITQVGTPGDPVAGRRVFAAKGCERCHGTRNDWSKPAPSLDQYRGRFSAIVLAQVMWNHGNEMAEAMRRRRVAWPQFAGREMGDLLAFLQAGNGGGGLDRVYFEPGSPRRGRELFVVKRCETCHAIGGQGGRVGPDLANTPELTGSMATVAGLMWNHSLGMSTEFRRRGVPRVSFSGQEMADVIAYLYFVSYATVRGDPARGAELFVANCSTCHSIGGGKTVGPDLGAVPALDDPIAMIAAMWNHAPRMEQEFRRRGLAWPQLRAGDTADLAAFLLARRGVFPAPAVSSPRANTGRRD